MNDKLKAKIKETWIGAFFMSIALFMLSFFDSLLNYDLWRGYYYALGTVLMGYLIRLYLLEKRIDPLAKKT